MVSPSRYRYLLLFFYFLFICFLFFIPGSALPKGGNWLSYIYFDKWVHAGIFGVLTYAAGWTWNISSLLKLLAIFLVALSYGIIVEIIQDHFIANRSFDLGDWAADGTGAVIGLWVWRRRWEKNRPL